MVSKASEDFPEPDRPVMTTRRSRGMETEMFFRLCWRAPLTMMCCDMANEGRRCAATGLKSSSPVIATPDALRPMPDYSNRAPNQGWSVLPNQKTTLKRYGLTRQRCHSVKRARSRRVPNERWFEMAGCGVSVDCSFESAHC